MTQLLRTYQSYWRKSFDEDSDGLAMGKECQVIESHTMHNIRGKGNQRKTNTEAWIGPSGYREIPDGLAAQKRKHMIKNIVIF